MIPSYEGLPCGDCYIFSFMLAHLASMWVTLFTGARSLRESFVPSEVLEDPPLLSEP